MDEDSDSDEFRFFLYFNNFDGNGLQNKSEKYLISSFLNGFCSKIQEDDFDLSFYENDDTIKNIKRIIHNKNTDSYDLILIFKILYILSIKSSRFIQYYYSNELYNDILSIINNRNSEILLYLNYLIHVMSQMINFTRVSREKIFSTGYMESFFGLFKLVGLSDTDFFSLLDSIYFITINTKYYIKDSDYFISNLENVKLSLNNSEHTKKCVAITTLQLNILTSCILKYNKDIINDLKYNVDKMIYYFFKNMDILPPEYISTTIRSIAFFTTAYSQKIKFFVEIDILKYIYNFITKINDNDFLSKHYDILNDVITILSNLLLYGNARLTVSGPSDIDANSINTFEEFWTDLERNSHLYTDSHVEFCQYVLDSDLFNFIVTDLFTSSTSRVKYLVLELLARVTYCEYFYCSSVHSKYDTIIFEYISPLLCTGDSFHVFCCLLWIKSSILCSKNELNISQNIKDFINENLKLSLERIVSESCSDDSKQQVNITLAQNIIDVLN